MRVTCCRYLYLLFSPHHSIALDKYVFNTEAHPLPVIKPKFASSIGDICDNAPYVCAAL